MSRTCLTIPVTLILFLIMGSCSKINTPEIAGDYSCHVDYSYWDIGPTNIDSSWTENIIVEQNEKEILLLDKTVLIDCLATDGYYRSSDYHIFFSVEIKCDSLFYIRQGGGMGGGSYRKYSCRKLD